ncbi:hypothetical protein BpHYR1_003199, partial [Brachionus plicatilis]
MAKQRQKINQEVEELKKHLLKNVVLINTWKKKCALSKRAQTNRFSPLDTISFPNAKTSSKQNSLLKLKHWRKRDNLI